MKKILFLLTVLIFVSGCFTDYEDIIKGEFGEYKLLSQKKADYNGKEVRRFEIEVSDDFEICDGLLSKDKSRIMYVNGNGEILPVLDNDITGRFIGEGKVKKIEKHDIYEIKYFCNKNGNFDFCSCNVEDVNVALVELNKPMVIGDVNHNHLLGVLSLYGNKLYEGYYIDEN